MLLHTLWPRVFFSGSGELWLNYTHLSSRHSLGRGGEGCPDASFQIHTSKAAHTLTTMPQTSPQASPYLFKTRRAGGIFSVREDKGGRARAYGGKTKAENKQ